LTDSLDVSIDGKHDTGVELSLGAFFAMVADILSFIQRLR
jgi:hypothetical protein